MKAAATAAVDDDDDDRTFTHQGPGAGAAGAADHQTSAAILRSARGAAPTIEGKPVPPAAPKGTAPAVEAKATATTPVAEAKAATIEPAAEALRERLAEDNLKLGASGDEAATTIPQPRTPGQQSSDSGTASQAASPGGSGTDGSGGGSSEGGREPFGGVLTSRLDAAAAGALSQVDAARPNLRGGLDVFQSAPGTSTTPSGSGAGTPIPAGPNDPNSSSDPGADHAADVAGQVTGAAGLRGHSSATGRQARKTTWP